MTIECFEVKWTKLYPFEKALSQPEAKEGGVYALYKSTGAKKRLHYIGKSKEFEGRFGSHKQATNHMMTDAERKRCFVSFGLISSFEKSRISNDVTPTQLRIVENFFIVRLDPIGNHDSTKKRYVGDYPVIIANTGTVTRPFSKFMSQSPALLNLLGKSTTKRKSASSSWP